MSNAAIGFVCIVGIYVLYETKMAAER